jgi:hypothetical protein
MWRPGAPWWRRPARTGRRGATGKPGTCAEARSLPARRTGKRAVLRIARECGARSICTGVERSQRALPCGALRWRARLKMCLPGVGPGSTYDAYPNGTRSQAAANQPRPLSSSGAPPPPGGCERVSMARHCRRCWHCCMQAMRCVPGRAALRAHRPGRSLNTLSELEACKHFVACHGSAS